MSKPENKKCNCIQGQRIPARRTMAMRIKIQQCPVHGKKRGPSAMSKPEPLGTCAECGHVKEAHFSCEVGSFCKECPTDNNVWEHAWRPSPQGEALGWTKWD